MAQPEFWFNLRTKQVEEGRQSSWDDLMGPYATREEAAQALEIAKRRNEQADEDDRAWREG